MPGRRLNDTEKKLLAFWQNPPVNFARPLLRQIELDCDVGLRGIHRLVVPIPYPFTAICGRNGVGKSTILALAALSATAPTGWSAYWGNIRRGRKRVQYTFGDFFHRRRMEPPLDGLTVGWVSTDQGNDNRIVRRLRNGKWATAEDLGRNRARAPILPVREVDFIPISRVLPAVEFGAVRDAFAARGRWRAEALNTDSVKHLSYVMGKKYQEAETRFIGRLGLAHCDSGGAYSGFDMGSGESAVLLLLSRLQAAPLGSLIVVEEIELGLHVEAQARLIEVILKICQQRRIQVICTTHSETVLDALPRQARVLIRRNGAEHDAIANVSARFAVHEMSGKARPELVIYTEDQLAAALVSEALSGPHRSRVDIRDVGSNATVAKQAIAHLRLHKSRIPALSVFDGDTTEAEVNSWMQSERAERTLEPNWLILPADGLSPEHWMLRELAQPAYLTKFCAELGCAENVGRGHLEAMHVQLNHHDCSFLLSQRTGLTKDMARDIILRSVVRHHPALMPLKERVAAALDGC